MEQGRFSLKRGKAKVLVLGTFHMFEHDGLYSEKRQVEIEELVSKIADFKATKIAVEMATEKTECLDKKYEQYKLATYKLEMNEIYQVGFRLGLKLGHDQIYPIDWMGKADMGFGEVETWAKENQPELLSEIYEGIFMPEITVPELTEDKSILDYYKELNEPYFLNKLNKVYVNMARIGDFNNNIGMKWLSWWYKRNLIMFASLTRLINVEEETDFIHSRRLAFNYS